MRVSFAPRVTFLSCLPPQISRNFHEIARPPARNCHFGRVFAFCRVCTCLGRLLIFMFSWSTWPSRRAQRAIFFEDFGLLVPLKPQKSLVWHSPPAGISRNFARCARRETFVEKFAKVRERPSAPCVGRTVDHGDRPARPPAKKNTGGPPCTRFKPNPHRNVTRRYGSAYELAARFLISGVRSS